MQDVKCVEFNRISSSEIECTMSLTSPPMLGESGMALLMQIVIINLLKIPGKDLISPNDGGGLGMIGGGGNYLDQAIEVQSNLPLAISAVEQQIKRSQLGENYPASERLARLGLSKENSIFSIDEPGESRGTMINIEIANEAGDTAVTGVFVPDLEGE